MCDWGGGVVDFLNLVHSMNSAVLYSELCLLKYWVASYRLPCFYNSLEHMYLHTPPYE